MFPGQCGNTAFFFKSQPDQFHFEFRGIVFPGKSFFSAHEVSTCKISGCLSYRILDSGPDGTQTTLTFNLLRIEEELSMAHLRLSRTLIEHLDWHQCIERYDRPHTLFYCDPPYWGTEGYGVEFGLENYDHMADLARRIKGKMIISVNDIPEMRQVFNGLNMQSVDISYNLKVTGKPSPKKELVICNF